jgi:hypothetical protein
MIKIGTKVEVRFDDSNPHLKGKKGIVVKESSDIYPFWVTVEIEKKKYPLRGSELKIIKDDGVDKIND